MSTTPITPYVYYPDTIWNNNTVYELDNAGSKTNDSGRMYLKYGPSNTGAWDNTPNNVKTNILSTTTITIKSGSYLSEDHRFVMIDIYDSETGTTTTARATYTAYANTDNNFGAPDKVITALKFEIASGDYAGSAFVISTKESNSSRLDIPTADWDADVPSAILCFLAGVEIETPSGIQYVENLNVNDEVFVVQNSNKIAQKITSVISKKITVQNKDQFPIRILKSAIADNVPYKDLLITPEHCLFINGQFIPARMLVNGRSIIQDISLNTYDIYHIETAEHSVVVANGALTESYLNTDIQINDHLLVKGRKTWKKDAAAPLNTSRDFVETIYKTIEGRAKSQSLADNRQVNTLTNDHGLYLTTPNNQTLSAIYEKDGYIAFRLPPNVNHVTIHSHTSRPSDVIGSFVDDRRNLGVLIGKITLSDRNKTFIIDSHLNTKDLAGWSVQEQTECRWTLGHAELQLDYRNKNTIGILRIRIVAGGPYIIENKQQDNRNIAAS